MKKKRWYDYLWMWTILYFALGFYNILFAWLGMIDFLVPLLLAIFWGNKRFCNRYCGRGQLLSQLGVKMKCTRNVAMPRWLYSKLFRYGFLVFFLATFGNMIYQTYLVGSCATTLKETATIFWTLQVPWNWAYSRGAVPDWIAQFSFGFYSLMLTSALLGVIVMALYKPRTWCAFCPMGTMTQAICQYKSRRSRPPQS